MAKPRHQGTYEISCVAVDRPIESIRKKKTGPIPATLRRCKDFNPTRLIAVPTWFGNRTDRIRDLAGLGTET